MKKLLPLSLLCFVCLFLDTAVLPRWNAWGIKPWMLLALCMGTVCLFSLQTVLPMAAIAGFCSDILCGPHLGLTPALLLLLCCGLYAILKENSLKKYILYLLFVVAALLFEGGQLLFALLFGAELHIGGLLYGIMFRALLTAGVCFFLMRLLRPLLKGQVSQ